jgi:hypothetical protein
LYELGSGALAFDDLDAAFRDADRLGKQVDQLVISTVVDWGSGDVNAESLAVKIAD